MSGNYFAKPAHPRHATRTWKRKKNAGRGRILSQVFENVGPNTVVNAVVATAAMLGLASLMLSSGQVSNANSEAALTEQVPSGTGLVFGVTIENATPSDALLGSENQGSSSSESGLTQVPANADTAATAGSDSISSVSPLEAGSLSSGSQSSLGSENGLDGAGSNSGEADQYGEAPYHQPRE